MALGGGVCLVRCLIFSLIFYEPAEWRCSEMNDSDDGRRSVYVIFIGVWAAGRCPACGQWGGEAGRRCAREDEQEWAEGGGMGADGL